MIKIENIEVWGFEHAIRGMRNPLNSWEKSDSGLVDVAHRDTYDFPNSEFAIQVFTQPHKYEFQIGSADMDLMRRLYKAGTEHRKYLRQIFVSMDIIAPLYWWKEFDTYKIGTVSNSCSTMHKIHAKKFELDDFSFEHLPDEYMDYYNANTVSQYIVGCLNEAREKYLETKDKKWWWLMIQLLPSSYNQRRTITMNYENVMTIINQRSNHKLDEWHDLIAELRKLPYVNEIRGEE